MPARDIGNAPSNLLSNAPSNLLSNEPTGRADGKKPADSDELYLDAAATEPVSRSVIEAMLPFLTDAYANPASVHQPGKTAARALAAARASLAADLGGSPDDVILTSGGTESDNLAVKGIALARLQQLGLQQFGMQQSGVQQSGLRRPQSDEAATAQCRRKPRPRIVISAIEHPAVSESAAWLERWFGFEIVRIPVDRQAHLDPDALSRELDGEAGRRTTLVCAMLANNEVGTIEPVERIATIAHEHGVPLFVDAVQAAGLIPIRMRDWHVDALSVSGHKFGAPKGLGALLVNAGTPIEPLISGGGQERGLRSGTQNVAGAVALAIALRESNRRAAGAMRALVASRDMLIDAVRRVIPRAVLTGDPADRLPGHASFVIPGVVGEALLVDLDARGIACSSGSACAVGRHEIPPTLLAMGIDPADARCALRMTFRTPLTREQIERVSLALEESYERLRPRGE
ncbi:cysteine desulfurase [Bifidobacterium jacchi]|uniref:cysteine desulfurase n=2 Tax=Bifidobacterium jacchi TaxID=2490545 RepID=A0A5N5RIB6_9BIFI|nr:cysteine desulfurase [Bifidobacterium jacchi]